MARKWKKTNHTGLRYFDHDTRKHGKKADRYYAVRFRLDGQLYEYGIGWLSDGIPKAIKKEEPGLGFEEYCLKLLREYKANIKSGTGPKSPKEKRRIAEEEKEQAEQERIRVEKEAVTLKAFFDKNYLPQAKADKKEKSVEREEGLFNTWISPSLGNIPMKDITPFNLERLKRDMTAGKQSPRSIEYALAIVRQIFNTAKRLGVFTGENPTSRVKFPKPDNSRMRYLSRKEAETLLTALKVKSQDVYDLTLLSLHCGLRFGEIKALTWQDVDTDKGIMTIRDAKAGSRYAFLTEQAAEMLKARRQRIDEARRKKLHKPCKPSDLVFEGRNGQLNLLSNTFRRIVEELDLNKGIDDHRLRVCFHTCRHSYASWMVEQGQDLYTVQKLLGHKTNVMTQRYAHLSENKLRDAANALSKSLEPQTTNIQVVNLTK